MHKSLDIKSGLLAKNVGLNLIGQGVPLIVAVASLPYVVHGLGAERFGILSIAWVVIGYFSMFDLGLGRSTTKFVAEALGKGETRDIPAIVWTALGSQLVIGILGSAVMALATPLLAGRILNIPPGLMPEAKRTFYILSASVPVIIFSISLRGVLEAAQRFDMVNAATVPANCLNFILPAAGVFMGLGLPGIVFLLLVLRIITVWVYLILAFRICPDLKRIFSINTGLLRSLFSFGGWVTLCSILGEILAYADRFFIGAIQSIASVGYYSLPADILFRTGIIPASFSKTLFPAFSTLGADKARLRRLYVRSLKYILLIMGPLTLLLIVFAHDLLRLWIGAEWAVKTTIIFQILAVGLLFNSLTHIPGNLMDGIGRPDLRAKIFLSYIIPYLLLLWFLVKQLGVVGAALAFTLRSIVNLLIFFGVGWKIIRLDQRTFVENGILRSIAAYGGFISITLFIMAVSGKNLLLQSLIAGICLICFAMITWRYVLDVEDKQPFFLAIKKLKGV